MNDKNINKNLSNIVDVILYIVMLIYIFFFIRIIIFKNGVTNDFRLVNFNPFSLIFDKTISTDILFKNIIGNIIAFIPMGILLPILINGLTFKDTIFVCLNISIIIEVIQYIFGLGITDISDVILNFAGGLIGSILYFHILKPLDRKIKYKIVTLLFLIAFGLITIFILWTLQPNMLGNKNVVIGLEELEGLDPDSYNIDALCIGIKDNYINTYTLSEEDKVSYNKKADFSIGRTTNYYTRTIEHEYSQNGNIQRSFINYKKINLTEFEMLLDSFSDVRAKLWIKDDDYCNNILLIY